MARKYFRVMVLLLSQLSYFIEEFNGSVKGRQ